MLTTMTGKGWKGLTAALLGTAWLYTAPVQAAPLNLTQQWPDLQVSDLDIAYNAGDGSFSAVHTSDAWFEYSDGSNPDGANDWTYLLTANLNSSGTLSSGSLTVQDESSSTPKLQLAGNLTAFGYQDDPSGNSDLFEFTFDVTDGVLAGDFGTSGGIIMVTRNTSTFGGDFGSDFTARTSSSDTFAVVPVPAAIWLFGSGILGLVAAARRRPA